MTKNVVIAVLALALALALMTRKWDSDVMRLEVKLTQRTTELDRAEKETSALRYALEATKSISASNNALFVSAYTDLQGKYTDAVKHAELLSVARSNLAAKVLSLEQSKK